MTAFRKNIAGNRPGKFVGPVKPDHTKFVNSRIYFAASGHLRGMVTFTLPALRLGLSWTSGHLLFTPNSSMTIFWDRRSIASLKKALLSPRSVRKSRSGTNCPPCSQISRGRLGRVSGYKPGLLYLHVVHGLYCWNSNNVQVHCRTAH